MLATFGGQIHFDLEIKHAGYESEVVQLAQRFMGYEQVKSRIGKVKCYKFIPIVEKGRLFKDEDDVKIWVSADANKIPVRIQFDLLVGSLRCDLLNYSNFSLQSIVPKVKQKQ